MAKAEEADLLTAVFEADKLRERYQQYAAPAAKIWIGTPPQELVQAAGVRIEHIRVSLHIDSAASADFSVTDIWDGKQNAIRQTVKKYLVCGAMVKIELGYGSELADVFHGFIYETGVQFSEMPSMQVTVMDVKRLMADNEEIDKVWEEQTLTNLFSTLMGKYSAFGLNVSVEQKQKGGGSGEGSSLKTFVQRGSDLSLVRKLCREHDLRFLVYGKEAKLTAKSGEAAVLTLTWGKDLVTFSESSSYVNMQIIVRGTIKKPTQKNTSGSGETQAGGVGNTSGSGSAQTGESGKKGGSTEQKKFMIEKKETVMSDKAAQTGILKSVKVIELTSMKSEDEAESRLTDEVERVKESMHSGRGSCIGMPVLIPGRYLGIDGIDDAVNGEYYLKAVSHTFGTDGFTTDFVLGGKK
ncbi:MAG: hypothetical protein NC409_04405 [Clostridium sp.]|nr:hypothetical protein [Clostridium sp.]